MLSKHVLETCLERAIDNLVLKQVLKREAVVVTLAPCQRVWIRFRIWFPLSYILRLLSPRPPVCLPPSSLGNHLL